MAKDTYKQYAQALLRLTQTSVGSKLSADLKAFATLLAKKQKLKQAARIIAEFERLSKKASGIVSLEIISAHKLSDKSLSAIKKAFGSSVEETTKIDASVLGGVSIKTEDKIFDATLKNQLTHLTKALNQ